MAGHGPGPGPPRPLRGKSFYLDLPSGRNARELAAAIGRLGGVTESFLSKEVSYVVSSNKEVKRDRARTCAEKWSNVTSDGNTTSPVASASKGNHTRPQQNPPDTVLMSRGRELLQKAVRNQDPCGGSSILASARLWGVPVLRLDEMLSYTQQLLGATPGAGRRCQQMEVPEAKCLASGSKTHKGKLKPPFLKVEDQSRQFRPFHHQFKTFPSLNFLAPKSCSPFEPLKSLSNSCRARGAEGCPTRSDGARGPPSTPATAPKRRRGFCECCQETFEELQKHLQSPQHRRFALDDSRYAPVDRLMAQLAGGPLELSARAPRGCRRDVEPAEEPREGREPPPPATEHGPEARRPSPGRPGPGGGRCAGEEATAPGTAPAAEAAAPRAQLGAGGRPAAPPPAQKRRHCPGQGAPAGKRPRWELPRVAPGGGGAGGQAAGQAAEPETGAWPRSAEPSKRPRSSLGVDPCPHGSPGDPATRAGAPGAAAGGLGPVGERGWSGVSTGAGGTAPGREGENAPRNVPSPGLESTASETSCPAGRLPSPKLPVAEARCCCSLCVGAAEEMAPAVAALPGPGEERAQHPGHPRPPPRAAPASSGSSGWDWDVQLLSRLPGGGSRSLDRDLLQRTHVSVRDSGYESQLCSVLKQKSELVWAGKEDKNFWNCCTETTGASFTIFETFFDSWTT